MKKYIGIAVVALIILVCLAWIFLQENTAISGNVAEIRVDNEVVQTLDLSKNTKITVQGKNNITLIVVVDGNSVYVESSECPDKICVNKGRISKEYETIVCLPAKTIVEVKTGQSYCLQFDKSVIVGGICRFSRILYMRNICPEVSKRRKEFQ